MLQLASYFLAFSTIIGAQTFANEPLTDVETSCNTCNINSFTGRVTRDRVRLRLQPTIESTVIKELDRGEMILVTGEENDFYAVEPISGSKAYIHRTFVLDGVVEGNKVNVRIDPHLEAPVIAQLNTGDRIRGKISQQNSKWLEIDPPKTTRFFISADFVEKIGDSRYLARHEERLEDVNNLLNGTYLISEQQLQKPYTEIKPEKVVGNYKRIINDFTEFPKQVTAAKEYLSKFQEAYLHKKIEYLEARAQAPTNSWNTLKKDSITKNEELDHPKHQTSQTQEASDIYEKWVHKKQTSEIDARMALWIPVEIAYYEEWAKNNEGHSIQNFYAEQQGSSLALRGILEPYDRPVRNKPGDYLLVNKGNRLPIAYLYSTQINLKNLIGQEVTLEGIFRPNNNFAYPAYFIMSVE